MMAQQARKGLFGRWLGDNREFFIPATDLGKYRLPDSDALWRQELPRPRADALADLKKAHIKYLGFLMRRPSAGGQEGLLLDHIDAQRRFFIPRQQLDRYAVPEPDVAGQEFGLSSPIAEPPPIAGLMGGSGPLPIIVAACDTPDC